MSEAPFSVPTTKDEVLQILAVSRETGARLEAFQALLTEENEKINLVAPGALSCLWGRHIYDSAQLQAHIPASVRSLADFGSGAGFPGMILAILGVPDVHLIESIGKKARFLEKVKAELGLTNVTVHPARVESLALKVDCITARAVTALPQLLSYAKPLMKNDSFCLFLKGQKAAEELTEARKYWTFKATAFPSASDPSGTILKIETLKVLRAHGNYSRSAKRS